MARPSKLSPDQWEALHKRLLAGETARSLGREFDVSEGAIRKRFGAYQSVSTQSTQVRTVAGKLADAHTALQALPAAQRQVAVTLSEQLRDISSSYAAAAVLGTRTGHRLHALANAEVCKVDDADPLSDKSLTALKGVGVLTKLANEALIPASNLIAANKDRIKELEAVDAAAHGDGHLSITVRRR